MEYKCPKCKIYLEAQSINELNKLVKDHSKKCGKDKLENSKLKELRTMHNPDEVILLCEKRAVSSSLELARDKYWDEGLYHPAFHNVVRRIK